MPHGMQKKRKDKKENDKKYDIRKTGKINPFICASADRGKHFSAVLQHGGHRNRRTYHRSQCPGGCRMYGKCILLYPRICYGIYLGIIDPHRAAVRRRR